MLVRRQDSRLWSNFDCSKSRPPAGMPGGQPALLGFGQLGGWVHGLAVVAHFPMQTKRAVRRTLCYPSEAVMRLETAEWRKSYQLLQARPQQTSLL